MENNPIDSELTVIAEKEKSVETALTELHQQFPQVFEQLAALQQAEQEVQKLKDAVKEKLIAQKDFDLHRVGKLRVSVSAVAKVKVKNIDEVEDKYKTTEVVVNEKKAREYLKVMGELPAGFEDATFYRLNWKLEA